jgi:hypothetical protein
MAVRFALSAQIQMNFSVLLSVQMEFLAGTGGGLPAEAPSAIRYGCCADQ